MAIGVIKKGAGFLLKAGSGGTAEVFTTVAKMRTTSFDINGSEVEGTNKDSNGHKELVPGAGIVSMSVGAAGVFSESASQVLLETRVFARTLDNYQLVFEGGRTYEVSAQVVSVSYAGEQDGEQTYNVSLTCSGEPTITPGA